MKFIGFVRRHLMVERAQKLMKLTRHRVFWRALRMGVAASVEHSGVRFHARFATVVDVGANRGQFAVFALQSFPGVFLHCFEPQPAAAARLRQVVNTIGFGDNIAIYTVAAGDTAGESTFFVAAADDSSSLLRASVALVQRSIGTVQTRHIRVEVARIDDVIDVAAVARPCLIKIDVQGYELKALQGAERLLARTDEVLVEASFCEWYTGQALAADVVGWVAARGFRLAGVYSPSQDAAGVPMQADFHLVRV